MRRRVFICGLAIICSVASVARAQAGAGPQVKLAEGTLLGSRQGQVDAFLGIPYAAAPVGDNRWRAPQPVVHWTGIRDARSYAADCAQHLFPGDAAPLGTKPSEDCLYLNVWRPAAVKAGSKRPVMVWLHGGGFVNGGSSAPVYSGAAFARDGVVLVSLNYRLGRFGFFAHPALMAEGGGGNFGFRDQIAALEWVKTNIAAFGGDPANVTLFGESAGGISVHVLMTSPMAKGLFAKAIVQSGAGRGITDPTHVPTFAEALAAGERFSKPLGGAMSASGLRALPADRVIGGLDMASMDAADYSGPMIDGETVIETPIDAYRARRGAAVPLLLGTNSMDGFPFGGDKGQLFAAFGPRAAMAKALYDPDGTRPVPLVATDLFADRYMNEPTRAVARILAPRQPVWLYRFDYVASVMQKEWGGAPHASEIPFIFDTLNERYERALTARDKQIAGWMHGAWIAFARSSIPLTRGRSWTRFAHPSSDLNYISRDGVTVRQDPLAERLDFVEHSQR
ncbi:carboxylesterase/lipase family protein [Sphingomonas sp.]|uniref:carboxylesterase/lipase family protein n=1 Tax=Sphingomonas sp. TaxID=28214 RepID=UPI003B3AFAF4